jgi:uncharacterized membrane protein YidH (DUF202 family)
MYFMLAYLAVEVACRLGWLQFSVGGTNGITVTVIGLTLAAVGVLAVSLLIGVGRWRRLRREQASKKDTELGNTDLFLAQVGVLLDLIFIFLLLATGAPALILRPCAWN